MKTTIKTLRTNHPELADRMASTLTAYKRQERRLNDTAKTHYHHILGNLRVGRVCPHFYETSLDALQSCLA